MSADDPPKKDFEDIGIESSAFEALERDFQEVLNDLVGDESLERFRQEYLKLHRALKKSHDNEKRLMKKCQDLSNEIVANAAKVATALKLSQEDQATIASLKKEIDKAWKMVDASHEKEARAKETIQQLKVEINNLSKLVEAGAGLTIGQEATVSELMKQKEGLSRERDAEVAKNVALRNEITELLEKVRGLESEKLGFEHEVHTLKDMINMKKAESEREQRRKERLEKELKELKTLLETRNEEIAGKRTQIQQAQEAVTRLEHQLREQRAQTDRAARDFETLQTHQQKLQQDFEEQIHNNTQLLAENSQRALELKAREEEIAHVKAEVSRVNKVRESLAKQLKKLDEAKLEVEQRRDTLRGEISALEREAEALKRQGDSDRKQIDDLVRERDILNKQLLKASGATAKQQDLVKISENTKKNLEQEINGYKAEAQKQRRMIYQLEKEREKYGADASEATSKYLQALEEVKIREMKMMDLQKRIVEGDTRLKQQQNLYEAVRSDRNLYSKNLIEAHDEIAEMKRKFKIMNHQIDQLKEEIQAKDHALVKEHFEHQKVEKEREGLKKEKQKVIQQTRELRELIQNQNAEVTKLNHIINEADAERLRQKKDYDQIINERDILGTQLIRRNDELALLYEKIKVMTTTLHKGEVQYRERVEDVRVLKLKIQELRRELHVMKSTVSNVDAARRETYRLQRELLEERTKVKALSEELENPLNVHRWRKLAGSDPGTYDMILKIQTLQRRLIAKTEEVVEKELIISEKEKLYVALKQILARQPGPETAEQLLNYQQQLREKNRQLKAMAAELNLNQASCNEFKYEIERLTRELQDIKKRYYELRRKDQLKREKARAGKMDEQEMFAASDQPRFAGGGFSLQS
jgi:chromosome segregation ATPase